MYSFNRFSVPEGSGNCSEIFLIWVGEVVFPFNKASVLKIRYVRVLSLKKLNPVLVTRKVTKWTKKVLYQVLHQVLTKYSIKYITGRTVLRKQVLGAT